MRNYKFIVFMSTIAHRIAKQNTQASLDLIEKSGRHNVCYLGQSGPNSLKVVWSRLATSGSETLSKAHVDFLSDSR